MNQYAYTREEIQKQVNLVEHISQHETIKQEKNKCVGSHNHNSKGARCLQVYIDTQTFHCWHCKAGGDVVSYEADRLNSDWTHAIDMLVNQYNLNPPNESTEQRTKRIKEIAERVPVQELMHEAFKLYHNNMEDSHRDYYIKRGLTEETCNTQMTGYAPDNKRWLVNTLYQETKAEKKQMLATGLFFENNDGTLQDRYTNRYIIPYWYNGQIVFSIGRAASPDMEETKKYIKHLTHGNNYPFVSETAVKHVLWGEDNIRPNGNLLVAEGILDAILAQQEFGKEFTVVSPTSIYWTNEQISRLCRTTAKVKEIIFVADAENSGAGEQGALRTAAKIKKEWEELAKKDPNQFFLTPNHNKKTKDDPDSIPRIPILKIARLRKPPEIDKIDLADYITKNKKEELRYWIQAAKSIEYEQWRIEKNPLRFFKTGTNGGYTSKRMADEIRLDSNYFMYTADQLYRYDKGVYRPDGEEFILQHTQQKLDEFDNTNRRSETVGFLKVADRQDSMKINQEKYILNLNNGLLDISTGEMQQHTPDYLSTTRIPIEYNKNAAYMTDKDGKTIIGTATDQEGNTIEWPRLSEPGKVITRFIDSIVPADCSNLIYEIAGNCLIPDRQYEKTFMFTGEGENGKGTLLRLITALIGKDNVSSIPLQELDENRFARVQMFGKLANIFADLEDGDIENSKYFKMVTSGEPMFAERKNENGFDFYPHATMVFSCNNLPRSKDTSHGFYRRWEFIPFNNRFDRQSGARVNNLIETLVTPQNLSALLCLSIEGLDRLQKNGGFSTCKATEDTMAKYKTMNDSVHAFVEDFLVEMLTEIVTKSTLYKKYTTYCKDNGNQPASNIEFNKRLKQNLPKAEEDRLNDSNRTRVWRNIRLNTDTKDN